MARPRRYPSHNTSANNKLILDAHEITDYLMQLRRINTRGSAQWRNINGAFISLGNIAANYFIAIVKRNLMSGQGLPPLSEQTLAYKRATAGRSRLDRSRLDSKPLVKNMVGKFIENPLLHTGNYLNSIRVFTDGDTDATSISFRASTKNMKGGKVTIHAGIVGGDEPIYPRRIGKKMLTLNQIAALHEFGWSKSRKTRETESGTRSAHTISSPPRKVWGPAFAEFQGDFNILSSSYSKRLVSIIEDEILGTEAERKAFNKKGKTIRRRGIIGAFGR